MTGQQRKRLELNDSKKSLLIGKSSVPGSSRPKVQEFKTEKVPQSAIFERLAAFLPQIRQANMAVTEDDKLEISVSSDSESEESGLMTSELSETDESVLDLTTVESSQPKVIEMRLGLGVVDAEGDMGCREGEIV